MSATYSKHQYPWFLKRYGWTEGSFSEIMTKSNRVLDAGAGIGQHLAWFAMFFNNTMYVATDASVAPPATEVTSLHNVKFILSDLRELPFQDDCFDLCYCDRVLMHLQNPLLALGELVRVTRHEGTVAFSVYRKKGLIRECVDEVLRRKLSAMDTCEAIEVCRDLAKLGRSIQNSSGKVDVPSSLREAGLFDSQSCDIKEFIYWDLLKAFWNDDYGIDGSTMINLEYYFAPISHTYTKADVLCMCDEHKLKIDYFFEEKNALSTRARVIK